MRNIILIFVAIILLSGCRPYSVDVQQGNILDGKTVAQLHVGMDKSDVKALLGTPILVDTFDSDIWLYAYTKQKNGGKIEKKKLTVKFKNNKLASIE